MPFNIPEKRVSCGLYKSKRKWRCHDTMMTSSNGNIFRVTDLCAGNSAVPMNSPHKGQWRGAVMFSLICAWINSWANNREAGGLGRHRAQYDITIMTQALSALLTPVIGDSPHHGPAMRNISSLLRSCSTKSWVSCDAQGGKWCIWDLESMGSKPRLTHNPTLSWLIFTLLSLHVML